MRVIADVPVITEDRKPVGQSGSTPATSSRATTTKDDKRVGGRGRNTRLMNSRRLSE